MLGAPAPAAAQLMPGIPTPASAVAFLVPAAPAPAVVLLPPTDPTFLPLAVPASLPTSALVSIPLAILASVVQVNPLPREGAPYQNTRSSVKTQMNLSNFSPSTTPKQRKRVMKIEEQKGWDQEVSLFPL